MKTSALARTVLFSLPVLLTALHSMAQVQITLPKSRFSRHEQIDVAVTNTGKKPISFCVEFGHWSFKDDSTPMEATPTPVYVQAHSKRGWHTLLIGPDIGSSRHSVVLKGGETQHYPFRVSDKGEMRRLLDYWIGESDRTCENLPRRKAAQSQVFFVQ
jgi:hypothetical protein